MSLQPDRSPTVPRFGDWDESDPTSSENYTSIFTRVREERQTEEGGFPVGTNISHADGRNRSDAENSKVHKSKSIDYDKFNLFLIEDLKIAQC